MATSIGSAAVDLNTIVNVTGIQLTSSLNSPLIIAWADVDLDVTNNWTEVDKAA